MNYGLPYKGSKNKLAERIISLLPQRTHLIDMFCGGCAVSHAALVKNRFEHIHINDINPMCPQFFLDVLDGKYKNDNRWISREDFYKLKDTDPYVAFVWSFGNNLRDYMYGKEIEPLKKALHYVLYYQDTSLAKELGYDMTDIVQIQDMDMRYSAILGYFNEITPPKEQRLRMLQQFCINGTEGADSLHAFSNTKGKNVQVEHYTRSLRLPAVSGGGKITTSSLDFADVQIPADSVIYCDIPYENTNVYDTKSSFDYERFYAWCERQTEPVFISSYNMPSDRFDVVAEFEHRSSLCATANNKVIERVFVPKHQSERGNVPSVQYSIFDLIQEN